MTIPAPRTAATQARDAEEALGLQAPELVAAFRGALPRASEVVARRLVAAVHREGLVGERARVGDTTIAVPGRGRVGVRTYSLGRVEFVEPVDVDPAELLECVAGSGVPAIQDELANASVNLAIAFARRMGMDRDLLTRAVGTGAHDLLDLFAPLDADERLVAFERLSTEGHNLHPCGRTRLGWRVGDLLAHDIESAFTHLTFLGVRRDLHVGDDVGAHLLGAEVPVDRRRYAITPVHPWQRRHILAGAYADLAAQRALIPIDVDLPALVTSSLRTLLVPGTGQYLKLSLDIQVTSTRRTISVASTRNGPVLSRLLPDLLENDQVLVMAEPAGSATVAPGPLARDRDIAAILRTGLAGQLRPGEVGIPAATLPAVSPVTGLTVLAEVVNRFARLRRIPGQRAAALSFLDEYTRLVLPPLLTLATRHGIAVEAHLQNCVPTFLDGVPHRLVLRDLAGLRVHLPRAGQRLSSALWPTSVIATTEVDVMRAKLGYTAIHAHLSELVVQLAETFGLDEASSWARIRLIVDETFDSLAIDPALTERARDDHRFLTAPAVPHKALLLMRLQAAAGQSGDIYVDIENPLWRYR